MTTTTIVMFRRQQGLNFVHYNYMDILAFDTQVMSIPTLSLEVFMKFTHTLIKPIRIISILYDWKHSTKCLSY